MPWQLQKLCPLIYTRWSSRAPLRCSQLLSLIVCDQFIVSMACVWSCRRNDELMYNACLAGFCMWVQYVVCPAVVEEEKKDRIHDQNSGETNWYMSSKDIRDRQNVSRVLSFTPVKSPVRSASSGLGPWRRTMAPCQWVVLHSLFRLFFNVLFWSAEVVAAS
jgi:hypothetical protein